MHGKLFLFDRNKIKSVNERNLFKYIILLTYFAKIENLYIKLLPNDGLSLQ